jgi:hypothetical protein
MCATKTNRDPDPPKSSMPTVLRFFAAAPKEQIDIFGLLKKDIELRGMVRNPLKRIIELYPQSPIQFVPRSRQEADTESLLFELGSFLQMLSDHGPEGLWLENGLKKSSEWALVRRLSRLALERIGWEVAPPSLSIEDWRDLLIDWDSRDN